MVTRGRVGVAGTGAVLVLVALWVTAVAPAARAAEPPCARYAPFAAENFPATPKVDHRLFPLVPGTQIVTSGEASVGGQLSPHTVTFTVTDLTKVINGVRALVLWDVDSHAGQVNEAELAFFAQDLQGNVWNLGEYPEIYDRGRLTGAPDTWLAGVGGAEAGVHLPAQPRLGEPYYIQGYAPSIKFLDCATTYAENQQACVPLACFDNVLVTDEYAPLDKDTAHQRKHYAPGVGLVRVDPINDPEGETLVLTERTELSRAALDAARKQALDAEDRAYTISKVYGQTARSERLPDPPPPPPAPPPPAPPPPDPGPGVPPGATAARLSVVLSAVTTRITRSGTAVIAVRCRGTAGVCRGLVDIYLRGTRVRIGGGRFAVSAGRQQVLRVRLTARALRRLRAAGRLTVVARTRAAGAGSTRVTGSRNLILVSRSRR